MRRRMNNRGQFSIIAAIFVAVILISSVMLTYSSVRYGGVQEEPQILSAIDETNLALKQVLGFTVGYYGSVLQVTGNSSYARMLADRYLSSGLQNVVNIRPEWGSSFSAANLSLSTFWFTNSSYSRGTLTVSYSLTGIGISDVTYSASCRLDVNVFASPSDHQILLRVTADGNQSLNDLGKQNFKFYRYLYSNMTWETVNPTAEPVAYTDGTYLIDIPSGMPEISPYAYSIQVEDTRGIVVAASSFSHFTSALTFNSTVESGGDYVDNNTSNVDGSPNKGTQSNFPAQQQAPDGVYDTLTEGNIGTVYPTQPDYYNPDSYSPIGSTTLISGTPASLGADDGNYMTFRSSSSGASAQTLFTHSETTSINGLTYKSLMYGSADGSGTSLTAAMSSSRVLLGKSVFSLQSVSSIPASAWTVNYRAWQDNIPTSIFDSASSVEAATPATSVSWSHTTGTASNRLLVVAVSVHVATGTPTTVASITYGGVPLTQVTTALYSTTTPQVRTYVFRLLNPDSGTRTIAVSFAASTLYVCGATTYADVDQSAPIQTFATATGSSTSPSVSVTATGTGRTVFGHLAGYRTAETTTQVTYVSAGTGSGTTGNPTPAYPGNLQANDLILLQVTVRDTSTAPTTPTGFTLLYGPDATSGNGRQWIYYKFSTGSESGTITVSIGGSTTKIARMYAFRNVALSSFTEGGGFGTGTGTTISAQSVTTTSSGRLGVSFVFITNNNAVGPFTGESGGDWIEPVAEYTSSAGNGGCIQLQTVTMASAGTLSGGSTTISSSERWGVRAVALKPKTTPQPWVITEGSGQNNRWARETNQYKGRGSDRLNVAAGTINMSWSADYAPNWVCSAVVINPCVPVGHCDIDVLIRKSDGTIRSVIATNVANSSNLTSTATTLTGTYSWGAYTVVDQTDYLEIDYYVDVTTTSSLNANLRIDDNSLGESSQTRITNMMLPTEQTCALELYGPSNLDNWNSLLWNISSLASTSGVSVTYQLYNNRTDQYPSSGDGYMTATLGTSKVKNESTINVNPTDYRDNIGRWTLRVIAVKSSTSPFNVSLDYVKFRPGSSIYDLDLEEQWINPGIEHAPELCIKTGTLAASPENLAVDVWNQSSVGHWEWDNLFASLNSNNWNNKSVVSSMSFPNFTIRFRSSDSNDIIPDNWQIDAVLLRSESNQSLFTSLTDAVAEVEVLQNGTLRWLGQNLQLMTEEIPIPPIPVKAIHVNQTTLDGVNHEVPFQLEDWASEYTVPLGLTNNATVFGNRQMIVSLVNTSISQFTIWWNGSDSAVQTPLAYTPNQYFQQDNPDGNMLTNGRVNLQFQSGFTVNSTVVGTTTSSSATFMRLNTNSSSYGAGLAYVIHHGVVRDVVQQEAEWSQGATNCPNVYANMVLTLPAGSTYYTYQLRLMFINSTQDRTISDLCPIKVSTSASSVQVQTEDGVALFDPVVTNNSGTFYNSSLPWTAHHWSQLISGSKGAGIMFTDFTNLRLYTFDSIGGGATGGIKISNSTRTIEFLPVTLRSASFKSALDVTWYGAVVTFDGSNPVYKLDAYGRATGLWVLAELPPVITVTVSN